MAMQHKLNMIWWLIGKTSQKCVSKGFHKNPDYAQTETKFNAKHGPGFSWKAILVELQHYNYKVQTLQF